MTNSLIRIFLLLFIAGNFGAMHLYAQYDEKYRPQFHFSPKKGWIGDPDGLIYTDSVYHLFWWGHATSKDMVYWEEQPYPMKGDDRSFSYFSGSTVVDKNNTAGFGANSMIAFYTMHRRGDSFRRLRAFLLAAIVSISNFIKIIRCWMFERFSFAILKYFGMSPVING